MKIKKEYLDSKISCPLTNQNVYIRFVDESLYNLYANNGYEWLFEEEIKEEIEETIEEVETKSKK